MSDFAVVVPWHRREQIDAFLGAWGVSGQVPPWLILQQDATHAGCAATKNAGIARALNGGAELVVVLDDDCLPDQCQTLEDHAEAHRRALEPQPVEIFEILTDPPSRGSPYGSRDIELPVAASIGLWSGIGDYCAVRQLANQGRPMTSLRRRAIFGRYFALSGMNLAFRPGIWLPWCRFVDVPRYDDVWMGWLWQREAYRRGFCFNVSGPVVRHARQSDVWQNLAAEAAYLQRNETLWRDIAACPDDDYEALVAILPPLNWRSENSDEGA